MADVARSVALREQIQLVARLRWRILRNSLRKKNNALDLIGMIAAGIFAGATVLGLGFAFYLGARSAFSGGHLGRLALLFWCVFLFWQIFPIFVAGFGASFEFRTLLRFPLSLTAFYLIGLAYGFADFAAIAAICWLAAMVVGVAAANSAVLPAMLWIVAVFIVMSVTFERLIGSWLERLLAQRRTREVIFALFILLSVSVQFLRPLLERSSHGGSTSLLRWVPYFSFFPPSLAGSAVASAATSHWRGLLSGTAGLLLYVAAFSGLLWHRFSIQYRGEELSETAAPARSSRSPEFGRKSRVGFAPFAVSANRGRGAQGSSLSFAQRICAGVVADGAAAGALVYLAICGQTSVGGESRDHSRHVFPRHGGLSDSFADDTGIQLLRVRRPRNSDVLHRAGGLSQYLPGEESGACRRCCLRNRAFVGGPRRADRLAIDAGFGGHVRRRHSCSGWTILHRQLGFAQFPTKARIRIDAWAEKFGRVHLDGIWCTTFAGWDFIIDSVFRALDRQFLVAGRGLHWVGDSCHCWLFRIPRRTYRGGGEKEGSTD